MIPLSHTYMYISTHTHTWGVFAPKLSDRKKEKQFAMARSILKVTLIRPKSGPTY